MKKIKKYKQISGVKNDFLSVKKKKNYGTYENFKYQQYRKNSKEEELKKFNSNEKTIQKTIRLESLFPEPVSVKPKNYRKHILTLQKRLENLRATEKFWPYVYRDIKKLKGKIVSIKSDDKYNNKIIYYAEGHVFGNPSHLTFIRRILQVNSDNSFGIATGSVIVYMDDRTAKPVQVSAAQVFFDNKLIYIDLNNLEKGKSNLINCLRNK